MDKYQELLNTIEGYRDELSDKALPILNNPDTLASFALNGFKFEFSFKDTRDDTKAEIYCRVFKDDEQIAGYIGRVTAFSKEDSIFAFLENFMSFIRQAIQYQKEQQ